MSYSPKDATPATAQANRDAVASTTWTTGRTSPTPSAGFIARVPRSGRSATDGHVIFDPGMVRLHHRRRAGAGHGEPEPVAAVAGACAAAGLFKVVDGLYQVRNNDIGDLTIVEGDDGLVIIDCMSGVESRTAGHGAVPRARQRQAGRRGDLHAHPHRPLRRRQGRRRRRPTWRPGKVPIIAPGTIASFDKFAIGENVVAGNAMSRRAALRVRQPARPRPARAASPAASGSAPTAGRRSPTSRRPTRSPRPAPSASSPAWSSSSSTPRTPRRRRRCTSGSRSSRR